ncbi:MAG: NfeD family protein [Pseudomonadota bacterium]
MALNFVLFTFLNGISPWWWIAFAIVLGIFEVTTLTTYLLGPALAALTVGLILMVEPGLSGTMQVTIFAVSMVGYGVLAWLVARRFRRDDEDAAGKLNRRGRDLVGREAAAEVAFAAGIGRVVIDGVGWRARLGPDGTAGAMPPAGARMRIVGVDGATLVVESLEAPA